MPSIHYLRGRNSGPKRVFVAVPTYSGSVGAAFLMSFFEASQILHAAGIAVDLCVETGNCHVDDARNALVREFIKTDCDSLIFIDEDVGFRGEDLLKLANAKFDLVAGVYPCKQMEEEYPVLTKPGTKLFADADGWVEVIGAPTGFMKISRSAINKMVEKFGQRSFVGRGQDPDEEPHRILFERTYSNGKRYSGDYAFCQKWLAIGGKIYVDPLMHFTHSGSFTWSGTLGDHWKRIHGLKEAQQQAKFERAVMSLKAGIASDEVFADLWEGWGNPFHSSDVALMKKCYEMASGADSILECGSGLSTVVMALANPKADIHTMENDHIWAMKTRDALEKHGLTNVTLHVHSLKQYPEGRWYDLKDVPDRHWDLVLCDGPDRTRGTRAVLFSQLETKIGRLLMDDTGDKNQSEPLKKWAAHRTVETFGDQRKFSVA